MLLTWGLSERAVLLICFSWNVFNHIKNSSYVYWSIPYALLVVSHITSIVLDINMTKGQNIAHHQGVRIATNINEMVAIGILILHHGYLVLFQMRYK